MKDQAQITEAEFNQELQELNEAIKNDPLFNMTQEDWNQEFKDLEALLSDLE